ncbi:Hepatitis C virus core protein [Vulcanococcus limneticus Candia 3F8]|uniref:hypothetical protein n=1 Tax=Vulcanococcus limneticus TaxID=2170428 RepID=UPI000B998215|nr:hypothetical protein [Vulcanococcus limneticus]MCP9792802.1 Hepatitis C virus core protein [Vulcanococcus limneticus MW73D5]MCP9894700.1 Hepatitis C virus core protein [Vulcanococcus limneticus Candia 3F8]MCP9898178.1 Hepatitis C virus core protein [Vulcanococcus limneticus Candia 3B3]
MVRSQLGPVLGFHCLAKLGLIVNVLALPGLLAWILWDGPLRVATVAVGLAAVLPALVLGVVANLALLDGRGWGRVLNLVGLGLGLAVSLGYGIVWLALVPAGRAAVAPGLGLLWLLQILSLVAWSLPPAGDWLVKRQPR